MDSCDVKTMTTLSQTSKFWDTQRNKCIRLRVLALLTYFQLDPQAFLDLLTRTSSVVSGSAALLVFCPGLFTPGDLDVYCSEGMLDEVLDHFETFTEYREPESQSTAEELAKDEAYTAWVFSENHLAKVLKLSCLPPAGSSDMESKLVNIIAVRRIPTISAVSHFHSTPVMNIITGTGAICVYPQLTLQMRGLVNTRNAASVPSSESKFARCLDKYRERGFKLAMTLGKWPGMKAEYVRKRRLFKMPLCVIPFPKNSAAAGTTRVPKQAALDDELWKLSWELSEWGDS
ncbi:hypothetical protein AN958_03806 [Leucoagaricus sp. SymC.cos]|nr:hypothetical protein AN958_03806 [Leucoagaricus sp. SymC.cos]